MAERQKVKKHLPKRCGNEQLKARRHASWLRGKERREQRRRENEARHRANVKRGYRTWDQYNEKRREAWINGGEVRVNRTPLGNIVRKDGSIEACCNAKFPCVHYRMAS